MYENHLILTFAFSCQLTDETSTVHVELDSSEKDGVAKIPFYSLHFLKPLEKAEIASLQSHKESIDISAHCSSVISFG